MRGHDKNHIVIYVGHGDRSGMFGLGIGGLVKPPSLSFGGLLTLDGPLAMGSTAKSKKRLYNLFGNVMTVLFPMA